MLRHCPDSCCSPLSGPGPLLMFSRANQFSASVPSSTSHASGCGLGGGWTPRGEGWGVCGLSRGVWPSGAGSWPFEGSGGAGALPWGVAACGGGVVALLCEVCAGCGGLFDGFVKRGVSVPAGRLGCLRWCRGVDPSFALRVCVAVPSHSRDRPSGRLWLLLGGRSAWCVGGWRRGGCTVAASTPDWRGSRGGAATMLAYWERPSRNSWNEVAPLSAMYISAGGAVIVSGPGWSRIDPVRDHLGQAFRWGR